MRFDLQFDGSRYFGPVIRLVREVARGGTVARRGINMAAPAAGRREDLEAYLEKHGARASLLSTAGTFEQLGRGKHMLGRGVR